VKTRSGATEVQSCGPLGARGSHQIEHVGPAHDEAELEALKAEAQKPIAAW